MGGARNNFQPTLHSLPLPFGESARFSAFLEWVAGGVGEKKRRGSKGEPINSGVYKKDSLAKTKVVKIKTLSPSGNPKP